MIRCNRSCCVWNISRRYQAVNVMDTATPRPRADQGVRVLVADTADAMARELANLGISTVAMARAIQGMAHAVRLHAVSADAARLVTEEMVAQGGEAFAGAPAAGVVEVVLLGTLHQYRILGHRLRQDPSGLPATADAIEKALQRFDDWRGELRCGPYTLPLGQKTYIMGIINVTPDSFSGDAVGGNVEAAVRRAEAMLADGAELLDIGGESTRPGSEPVALEDELRRVVPAVRALAGLGVPISVDTYKSEVARAALEAGATLVNDISGLRFDPAMADVVAAAGVPVVVMHIQGTPRTMQQQPHYDDLMTDVCAYLQASTDLAVAAGIPRDQVVLDPGYGFGKTLEHNLELLRRLRELRAYGQPVLLGTSRKSSIGKLLGDLPPEERVEGTAATVALGVAHGADIMRVHDVKAMARVARVADAVVRGYNT